MRRGLLALAALAAVGLGGPAAWAKLALLAGLPGLAATFATEPAIRGVALYQARRFVEADAAFAEAGRAVTYNRGLSLAALGNYPLAEAYFDAVLFANPADSEARENRDRVAGLYDPVVGQGDEAGRIAVQVVVPPEGPPTERFSADSPPLGPGRRVADDAWLATLPDDPGEFLRLRLSDEYTRRLSLGFTPPEEGDPW
ncbi:hypothetical protein [Cereibacter johrii]|uniref:Ca-activated chloride channel family protein n=1 Tax=Cereibacter johrii TaxID=445629 RepID=A0ABX5J5Y6_9RHOB|nr:hypothetical protein [Cereibacter johrii]ODM43897.1 hypothetical protein A9O63_01485 [Cereibacter johrii]PTM78319.1 Ca-activated chloride channel family protein [Cereibacter johrii]